MKKWMLWPAFMLVFPPVVVGGGAEEISMRLLKPAFVFQPAVGCGEARTASFEIHADSLRCSAR